MPRALRRDTREALRGALARGKRSRGSPPRPRPCPCPPWTWPRRGPSGRRPREGRGRQPPSGAALQEGGGAPSNAASGQPPRMLPAAAATSRPGGGQTPTEPQVAAEAAASGGGTHGSRFHPFSRVIVLDPFTSAMKYNMLGFKRAGNSHHQNKSTLSLGDHLWDYFIQKKSTYPRRWGWYFYFLSEPG